MRITKIWAVHRTTLNTYDVKISVDALGWWKVALTLVSITSNPRNTLRVWCISLARVLTSSSKRSVFFRCTIELSTCYTYKTVRKN